MPSDVVNGARQISNFVTELERIENQLNLLKKLRIKNNEQLKQIKDLSIKKLQLLNNIDNEGSKIYKLVYGLQNNKNLNNIPKPQILPKPQIVMPKEKEIPAIAQSNSIIPNLSSLTFNNLTKQQKKKYITDLGIDKSELKEFIKLQKYREKNADIISLKKADYNIYKPSGIAQIANKFMKTSADNLINKYPQLFEPIFRHFNMVEMDLLSRSYISVMLFFTLLSLPAIFLFFLALNFAFNLSILMIILISILGMFLTLIGFYFYPASLIGGKNDKIKLELPFALVHMSAVAGSGAQPISIFQLIVESDEYPELKKEIKKILNYVNLFGYNLTNALRNVAQTTPNPEFKELLNGMISTIETGGDLRGYLKEKAEDALNLYKLDRKKQVEALATYAEIYTAILIASPLLMLVTLAIINSIGGNIGGLSVSLIAWLGILGALPLLNIGFMLFINSSQKGL